MGGAEGHALRIMTGQHGRPALLLAGTPLAYTPVKLNATAASEAPVEDSQAAESDYVAPGMAGEEGSERRRLREDAAAEAGEGAHRRRRGSSRRQPGGVTSHSQ